MWRAPAPAPCLVPCRRYVRLSVVDTFRVRQVATFIVALRQKDKIDASRRPSNWLGLQVEKARASVSGIARLGSYGEATD